MGERTVPLNPDEQYPLLKIEGGGGDINHATPAQTVVTPGWGVTCTKTSRFSRWPEFLSACWMTLILCGISYLVFHTLAMGLYRRPPLNNDWLERKCNDSKPANKVFYHHIVPRESQIPLLLYSEHLANMAIQYPLLHYNVYFLVDDLYPNVLRGQKRNNSWLHHNHKLDDIGKETFNELLKRYKINLTIMSLSEFMAMTPLKFKWRLLPRAHLTFYARVFSVWRSGGIGIDLGTYNNDYHNHLPTNPRIDAILRQHNDGINAEDYTKTLNKIDNDEASTVINMFAGIINNILNETRSFFNRTLLFPPISMEKSPSILAQRNKRETKNGSENIVVSVPSNDPKNFYNVDDDSLYLPINFTKTKNESTEVNKNTTTTPLNMTSANATDMKNRKFNGNNAETRQVVLLYDFSLLTGHTGPSPTSFLAHKPASASKTASDQFLSIDAEGMFIAASSRYHPFLARLVSADGYFTMPPKFAIRDVFASQCGKSWGSTGINGFKEDAYCNNIYIL